MILLFTLLGTGKTTDEITKTYLYYKKSDKQRKAESMRIPAALRVRGSFQRVGARVFVNHPAALTRSCEVKKRAYLKKCLKKSLCHGTAPLLRSTHVDDHQQMNIARTS